MTPVFVTAFNTPVQDAEQDIVQCPMCLTTAYILSEDFAAGDSYFCVNPECRFWLSLPNGKNDEAEAAQREKLRQLNENRRRKTKKYQRRVAQSEHQQNLFGGNGETVIIEQVH